MATILVSTFDDTNPLNSDLAELETGNYFHIDRNSSRIELWLDGMHGVWEANFQRWNMHWKGDHDPDEFPEIIADFTPARKIKAALLAAVIKRGLVRVEVIL